jgi:hypothetical protein
MKLKRLFTVFAILLLTLAAAGQVLAQGDPFVGTWKLDVAKSKFDPGPAPQSQTRTWGADGKVGVEGINAAGKPMSYGYPIMKDGKEYPTIGAIPNKADTISTKRINDNTVEANFVRGGKPAETTKFEVSKDGKMLTIDAKGTNADGSAFHNVTVWEKQ